MKLKDINNVYRIFDKATLRYLSGIKNIRDERDYLNKKSALEQICPPCGIGRSKSLLRFCILGLLL